MGLEQYRPVRAWRFRVFRFLASFQWPFIGTLFVGTVVAGIVGFSEIGAKLSGPEIIYRTLQLFVLEFEAGQGSLPLCLEIARFAAPFVSALTVVKAITIVLSRQVSLLRARFFAKHMVVIGLGELGTALVRELLKEGLQVVAIEADETKPGLAATREYGAVIVYGDARDPEILKRANIRRANAVVIVAGNNQQNAGIALEIRENYASKLTRELVCFVHIDDPNLSHLLKMREIELGRPDRLRFEFFDVYSVAAQELLDTHPPVPGVSLQTGVGGHVVLLGLGKFGQTLFEHLERYWWNQQKRLERLRPAKWPRLRITVVAVRATAFLERLKKRQVNLESIIDFQPIDVDPHSQINDTLSILDRADSLQDASAVYSCIENIDENLAISLELAHRISNQQGPVVMCMRFGTGLTEIAKGGDADERLSNLYSFGIYEGACHPRLLLDNGVNEFLARAIHENWVEEKLEETSGGVGHPALVNWDFLSEEFKNSNRHQATHIGEKLRIIQCDIAPRIDWKKPLFEFTPSETEKLSRMEHERWENEKRQAGWKPGARDLEKKTTPYLVDYDDLPERMKQYDRNAVLAIPNLMARLGYDVVRQKRLQNEE